MAAIKIIRSIFIVSDAGQEIRNFNSDDLYIDHCMTLFNPSFGIKTEESIHSECMQDLINYVLDNIWGADIRDVTGEDIKWLLSNIKFKNISEKEKRSDLHTILQGVYEDKENNDMFIFKYQYIS